MALGELTRGGEAAGPCQQQCDALLAWRRLRKAGAARPRTSAQPVAGEALWDEVGVTGFKKGDRAPPNGKFTYHWHTFGWPTTAGVWLYHDHSFCDTENVKLGAIGLIVIHNEADPDDVIDQDLPGGQPTAR